MNGDQLGGPLGRGKFSNTRADATTLAKVFSIHNTWNKVNLPGDIMELKYFFPKINLSAMGDFSILNEFLGQPKKKLPERTTAFINKFDFLIQILHTTSIHKDCLAAETFRNRRRKGSLAPVMSSAVPIRLMGVLANIFAFILPPRIYMISV